MRAPAPHAKGGAGPVAWRGDAREACIALAAVHGIASLAAALLLALCA